MAPEIVKKNLKKMMSDEEGGMKHCLVYSATMNSYWENDKHLPISRIMFYYADDGQIVGFGNYNETSEYIRREFLKGVFDIISDLRKEQTFKYKVVGRKYETCTSPEARENLRESVRQFNRKNECVGTA